MLADRSTAMYFYFLVFILLLGLFGPMLAPYDHSENHYGEDGVLRGEAPSMDHPLGTNDVGRDTLSRVLVGARPTIVTGLLGGTMIASIGLTIGIISGYAGGKIGNILMRFTDFVYSIPLIPFAIIASAFIGVGFIESIIIIGLLLWRGSARVIRSQVLQIKERPFITATKAAGASSTRIVLKHILPNVAPMAVLFFALGIGYSIILQAGLAFIGVSSPFVPSWGVMIRNAYDSGLIAQAWYWPLFPGLMISLTVLSTFMFGRGYEELSGGEYDEATTQAG